MALAQEQIDPKAQEETFRKEVKSKAEKIYVDYGVTIHFDGAKSIPFEALGGFSTTGIEGGGLSYAESSNILPTVEKFLSSYPPGFIRENLKHIYLFKNIEERTLFQKGKPVGGIFFHSTGGRIYIMVYNNDPEYTLQTFHHEFAHNLQNVHSDIFPWDSWIAFYSENPYLESNWDKNPIDKQDLLKQGFVCDYSRMNVREDFATLMEEYFTEPKKLEYFASLSPILSQKIKIAEYFYQKIGAIVFEPAPKDSQ